MNLANNSVINLYSIVILLIVYVHSVKHSQKDLPLNRLFVMILQMTFVMLIIDILGRFDGKPDTFLYPFMNQIGNFLIYLLNPVMPSLWLLYIYFQIYEDKKYAKHLIFTVWTILGLNLFFLILSQRFGWYYYIDSANIYHRGPVFWFPALIIIGLMVVPLVLIILNRKKIYRDYYTAFVLFSLPPFIGTILQIFYYGFSFVLNGVVISILIVFLNIQNINLYTDYLTGVNNRKKLEMCLKAKISTSTEKNTFAAILIDLDDFKFINDTYGHDTGDKALQASVEILHRCLDSKECIFRFGGDEFCAILDISDMETLEKVVNIIKRGVDAYNKSGTQPFKLGFSMGYSIYDYDSKMSAEEFQKQIDMMMYYNKRINKDK